MLINEYFVMCFIQSAMVYAKRITNRFIDTNNKTVLLEMKLVGNINVTFYRYLYNYITQNIYCIGSY